MPAAPPSLANSGHFQNAWEYETGRQGLLLQNIARAKAEQKAAEYGVTPAAPAASDVTAAGVKTASEGLTSLAKALAERGKREPSVFGVDSSNRMTFDFGNRGVLFDPSVVRGSVGWASPAQGGGSTAFSYSGQTARPAESVFSNPASASIAGRYSWGS